MIDNNVQADIKNMDPEVALRVTEPLILAQLIVMLFHSPCVTAQCLSRTQKTWTDRLQTELADRLDRQTGSLPEEVCFSLDPSALGVACCGLQCPLGRLQEVRRTEGCQGAACRDVM